MLVVAALLAGMVIALAASLVIQTLAGDALYDGYFVVVLTLALVAPIFRSVLDEGAPAGGGRVPA